MEAGSQKAPGSAKSGISTGLKIAVGFIAIILILIAAMILTLTVTVSSPNTNADYPYTVNYAVSIPEGQQVTVGNAAISVLTYENELVGDVNGNRRKLVIGESRVLAEQGAKITTLGIPVLQTNFQITLTYTGELNNRAYFTMTIRTERQVPEFVLRSLLPSSIAATTI